MNWFRANRWLGRFVIAVAMGALVALGFLFRAKGSFTDAKTRFGEVTAERNRLERRDPFPNEANFRQMQVRIENYGVALNKFKEELKKHVLSVGPLAPNEFQTRLRQAMAASAEKARANKVKLPDNFHLGFDEFTAALPSNELAPLLAQELAQVELLINILIEARVDGVTALKRTAETHSATSGQAPASTTSTLARKTAASAVNDLKVIEHNVVDLRFVAVPSAARKVLNQIGSSNQQLYIVRVLHVRNEKEKGPPREGGAASITASALTNPTSNAALHFIVGNEHVETSARIEMLRLIF